MKFESYEEIDEFIRKVLENRYEEYVINNDAYLYIVELLYEFDGKRIRILEKLIENIRDNGYGENRWLDMSFLQGDEYEMRDGEGSIGVISDNNEIVAALKQMYEDGYLIDYFN